MNLRLRIFPPDPNGYHPLETIFCRISLADSVRVEWSDEPGVRLRVLGEAGDVAVGDENLMVRAASAWVERTGYERGVEMEVEKRIPVAAGLGGGSSDAGAVLRVLNAAASGPLSPADLLDLALELGSDVPFFTADIPAALGWGRGERLTQVALSTRPLLLLVPDVRISTAAAFRRWDEHRTETGEEGGSWSLLLSPAEVSGWEAVRRLARNDFEPVIFRQHLELAELKKELEDTGPVMALLSGSGSTLFGVYQDIAERDAAAARFMDREGIRPLTASGPV